MALKQTQPLEERLGQHVMRLRECATMMRRPKTSTAHAMELWHEACEIATFEPAT